MGCIFFDIHTLLGKKWTLLILQQLQHLGPQSFSELREALKVPTNKVLSTRLSELTQEEILDRKEISSAPITVIYSLTDKGKDLITVIDSVKEWATKYKEVPEHCVKHNCTTCSSQELTSFR